MLFEGWPHKLLPFSLEEDETKKKKNHIGKQKKPEKLLEKQKIKKTLEKLKKALENPKTKKKPDFMERGGLDKLFLSFLPAAPFHRSVYRIRRDRFFLSKECHQRHLFLVKQYCIIFKETWIKACRTVLKECNSLLKCNCFLKNTFSK